LKYPSTFKAPYLHLNLSWSCFQWEIKCRHTAELIAAPSHYHSSYQDPDPDPRGTLPDAALRCSSGLCSVWSVVLVYSVVFLL
jgi:hypothetical protein